MFAASNFATSNLSFYCGMPTRFHRTSASVDPLKRARWRDPLHLSPMVVAVRDQVTRNVMVCPAQAVSSEDLAFALPIERPAATWLAHDGTRVEYLQDTRVRQYGSAGRFVTDMVLLQTRRLDAQGRFDGVQAAAVTFSSITRIQSGADAPCVELRRTFRYFASHGTPALCGALRPSLSVIRTQQAMPPTYSLLYTPPGLCGTFVSQRVARRLTWLPTRWRCAHRGRLLRRAMKHTHWVREELLALPPLGGKHFPGGTSFHEAVERCRRAVLT